MSKTTNKTEENCLADDFADIKATFGALKDGVVETFTEFREAPTTEKLKTIALVAGITVAAFYAQNIPETTAMISNVLQNGLDTVPDALAYTATLGGNNTFSDPALLDGSIAEGLRQTVEDLATYITPLAGLTASTLAATGFTKNCTER